MYLSDADFFLYTVVEEPFSFVMIKISNIAIVPPSSVSFVHFMPGCRVFRNSKNSRNFSFHSQTDRVSSISRTQSHIGPQTGCSEICFSIFFSTIRSAKHLLSGPPIGVPPFCLKNPSLHSKYGLSVHNCASLTISSFVRSVLFCRL